MNDINSIEKKEYYQELNILRAISIVLVILGHSFISGDNNNLLIRYIIKLIYSFHMPIFFFISGFFALKIFNIDSNKDKLKFLKYKAKRLIIPYFIVTALAIPIKLLMNSFVKRPIVLNKLMIDIFIFPSENPVASLWFIYTLFIIFLISIIFNRFSINIMLKISIITLILDGFVKINIFNIYGVFRNLIFFYIGLLVRKNYTRIKKYIIKNKIKFLISTLIILLFINIVKLENQLINQIFYLITGVSGIISFGIISIEINNFNIKNNFLNLINFYALEIYLFSWFSQNCIGYIMYKILNINYSIIVLLTFISGFIPIVISKYIIRKNKILIEIFT